jgi:uncharacterized membrane protein
VERDPLLAVVSLTLLFSDFPNQMKNLKSPRVWVRTLIVGAIGGGLNAVAAITDDQLFHWHAIKRTFLVATATTGIGLLLKSPLFTDGDDA